MFILSIILLIFFLSDKTSGSIVARYIRWSSGGSTSNPSTHFNEIQIMTSNNILASANVRVIYGHPEDSSKDNVIDGDINSYTGYGWGGHQFSYSATLELDFGSMILIKSIKFWQYFADGSLKHNITNNQLITNEITNRPDLL